MKNDKFIKKNGFGKYIFHQMMFPNHLTQSNTFNSLGMISNQLIEAEGARLLRENRV
ncbi:hypothetical protein [Peribacillus simplex]|uniref:hypothetical protein n=1 Tax=Peribacillus simplex TaxID=1478 RepID=UPI003D2A9220